MKRNYEYEWIEQLITIDLNPDVYNAASLDNNAAMDYLKRLKEEKQRITIQIKQQIFVSKDEEQSRLLVQMHHAAVVYLVDQAFQAKVNPEIMGTNVEEVFAYASIVLEELQQYIEVNYYMFLSEEARVPLPELLELKETIAQKLEILPDILKEGRNSDEVIEIALDVFYEFIDRIDRRELITVKEANYHRDLLKDLEMGNIASNVLPNCPTLHEMLFTWNLNSKKMIRHFNTGLNAFVAERQSIAEKLEFLHFNFKQLLHLPVKPGMIYNNNYPSIKSYFTDWIQNEIDYLQRDQQKQAPEVPDVENLNKTKEDEKPEQVLINLSADQIGMLLRGLKELNVLVAKSFDALFQAIIPKISTQQKKNLSWKSVRGKIYNNENRDKSIVIAFLTQLIELIETY